MERGRRTHRLKYIHELHQFGYSVYTFDHRCQGLSGRAVPGHHQRVHVDDFRWYVDDMLTFVDNHVPKHHTSDGNRLTILAHSMGGMVASLATLRRPELFRALVLCAPM